MVNWGYTILIPDEKLKPFVDFASCDLCENSVNQSLAGHFGAAGGIPFELVTFRMHRGWLNWTVTPPNNLKQTCATILAHTGICGMGDLTFPDGTLDPAAYEIIGETFQFVKEREPYCIDAVSVPYIAVLHGAETYYLKGGGVEEKGKDWTFWPSNALTPIRGVHLALVQSGIHFHIVNEETFRSNVSSYKSLIMADQVVLDPETSETIRSFVKRGGGLIATYMTSMKDSEGKSLGEFGLKDVFGVEYVGQSPFPTGYMKISNPLISQSIPNTPMYLGERFLKVKPTTAEEAAKLIYPAVDVGHTPPHQESMYPAITLNKYGKGIAAYIAGEIFSGYWNQNYIMIRRIIANLLDMVTQDKLLIVKAPPSIEVSLTAQGNRTIVHLVNHHEEKRVSTIRTETFQQMDWLPTIEGIKVSLKLPKDPDKVYAAPEKTSLKWKREGEYISIEAPKTTIWSMIVIES